MGGRSRRGQRPAWVAITLALGLLVPAACGMARPAASPAGETSTWRSIDGAQWQVPADELRWLKEGTVPGEDTRWADMVRFALLDIRQLTQPNGAVAAAPAASWRYTWPRDAAFAAAAMAVSGHAAQAWQMLHFLQQVQLADGGFEARYLLSGAGSPDERTRQSDGAGWALWGLAQVARADDGSGGRHLSSLRPLLDRATRFILDQTEDGRRLPPPSPDYWEMRERRLTLGTVAPMLAGLRSSGDLYGMLGAPVQAAHVQHSADRLEALIIQAFGRKGFQRYVRGGGQDAATAFLMPPFDPSPTARVEAAWTTYQQRARRPSGGLSPGAGWTRDDYSWTPEIALVAYTAAASGRTDTAAHWLDWLDDHRTAWRSLPEKVLDDGRPAGPAPLGWTAASVVLAVALLHPAPRTG